MQKLISTIDLAHDYACFGLYSRRLWEHIFRLVRPDHWRTMDNFLLDLRGFQECLEKGEPFYWTFNEKGVTRIYEAPLLICEDCLKIVFVERSSKNFARIDIYQVTI